MQVNFTETNDVFYLGDDGDDALIFSDALYDITPDLNCIPMPNEKVALRMLTSGLVPYAIFLDLNNLREKPILDFLESLKDKTSWKNIKIIGYSNAEELSDEKKRSLEKMGVEGFVIKTSDFQTLKEAFTISLGLR